MKKQAHDITNEAVLEGLLSSYLQTCGFRYMQTISAEQEAPKVSYILPPMIRVPAGRFLMGSDKTADPQAQYDEEPQRSIFLEAYEIGKYPLTVAEYTCFIQTTHHPLPQFWERHYEQLDHPVTWISWDDALAYVQWLAQISQQPWHVPLEEEWEKAARGTDGRIYPWGNELIPTNMTPVHFSHTERIGSYPQGANPYGLLDVVSNVWEWTGGLEYHDPVEGYLGFHELITDNNGFVGDSIYRRVRDDNHSYRVLRGGSWYDFKWDARVALRKYDNPSDVLLMVGMRLARDVTA